MGFSRPIVTIKCDGAGCDAEVEWEWPNVVSIAHGRMVYLPATYEWFVGEECEITDVDGWTFRDDEVFCDECAARKGLHDE